MRQTFIPGSFRPSISGDFEGGEDPSGVKSKWPTHSSSDKPIDLHCPVVLASKSDAQHSSIIDHQLEKSEPCAFLYWEELGSIWSFSYRKDTLTFTSQNAHIHPTGLYHRKCLLDEDHLQYTSSLLLSLAIDLWSGRQVGSNAKHFANSSKPYQMLTTIAPTFQSGDLAKFPTSFLFKGTERDLRDLLATEGSLIAKSCSGIRSHVVDETTFLQWNLHSLNALPTLFQRKVSGSDIRVHLFDKRFWAVQVKTNSQVDYRFGGDSVRYLKCGVSASLLAQLQEMALTEDLTLSGIDLMRSSDTTFCLEINPSPAWCAFDLRHSKQLAKAIVKFLARPA